MITRSTHGAYQQVSLLMQRAATRLQESQLDAAGLDRLRQPSSHPADAARAVQLEAELATHQALTERLGSSASELAAAEGVLGQAASLLTSAIEIAVDMASEPHDAGDRALAAERIEATIADMVTLANTSFGGIYLFSGTAVTTAAFDGDGTYQGASGARSVPLLQSDTLEIGLTGDEIFRASGADVFDTLSSLQAALEANDAGEVGALLDELESAHEHLVDSRAAYGMAQARIEDLSRVSDEATITLKAFLGSLEELDPVDAFSRLAEAQTVYQSAAMTMTQVLQTNIFQYL